MMTNVIKQEDDCSNIISRSYNSILSSVQQGQDISVNSSKHLNGSVMTVQNSSARTHLGTASSQRENLSALKIVNVIVNHPTASFTKPIEKDSSEIHSMSAMNAESSKIFTPNTSKIVESDTVHSTFNLVVNCDKVTVNPVSSACFSLRDQNVPVKKKKRVRSTSPKQSLISTSLVSTGLQSGAVVQIKPHNQPNEKPIYISESEGSLFSTDGSITINEPLDFVNIQKSNCYETSSFKEPIIVDVCSIKAEDLENEDLENNRKTEDSPVKHQDSSAPESSVDDKDYEYLMGMLPQLKELPRDLKLKFKRDVYNLLAFAVISADKLKKETSETDEL